MTDKESIYQCIKTIMDALKLRIEQSDDTIKKLISLREQSK